MLRLNLFLILAIVTIKKSDAVCGVCNTNGIRCITKTEFQLCNDKVPDTRATFSCLNPNEVCTIHGMICADPTLVENGAIKPACGDTSLCGVCTDVPDGRFACTSRTTLAMCWGGTLTNQTGSCRQGYLCDPKNVEFPCERDCFVDESTICDLETPIGEPTLPPTDTTTVITATTPVSTPTAATAPVTTVTTETPEPITSTQTTSTTLTPEPITSTQTTSTTLAPTTTTTSTTITTTNVPTVTQSPSDTVCRQRNSSGRFPYLNESDCSGYIYCYWKSGSLMSNTFPCPAGRHFNKTVSTCVVAKPVWCS